MRALFPVLACLLPLLAGCEKSAAPVATSDFDKLMADGARANLAGRPTVAEANFREALGVRRAQAECKTEGENCLLLALPLMSLALQLSNEGRYPEAEAQFASAARVLRIMPGSGQCLDAEPRLILTERSAGTPIDALVARLNHYRGVHLLNQHKSAEADASLRCAQSDYEALIPAYILNRSPLPKVARNPLDVNAAARARTTSNFRLLGNSPVIVADLLGLIEVRRNRAIALRDLGQYKAADAMIASAEDVARRNDLDRPSVEARMLRTTGITATAEANETRSVNDLRRSDEDFEVAYPSTKEGAETALLHAAASRRTGDDQGARQRCDRGVQVLVEIHAATKPELMAPCLELYSAGGLIGSDRAQMFLAAQVAQGSITSHQIAQASASLTASEHNPKLHEALRQRDLHQRNVDQIYRALDAMNGAGGAAADAISQKQQVANQEQAELASAEATVRALAPNFGQLVQDVVSANNVFSLLRRDEALIAIFLGPDDGWTFALRDGRIAVSRIKGGAAAVDPLVTAVRTGVHQKPEGGLPDFDVAAANRLYDLVLGGVAGEIDGANALVIAPSGSLLTIPFEVLLTGPADRAKLADAPWLVRKATITHVPAPSNFVSLRGIANRSAAGTRQRWFGFGEALPIPLNLAQATFPPGSCGDGARILASLPPLSGASNELNASAALLGANANNELLGAAFTADDVGKVSLKDRDILHFAAHALLPTDLRCETDAAIVTSPPPGAGDAKGALLTASRILSLDLSANLVILSACDSGGAGEGAGESLSSLARSFFYQNAQSLLVTHWAISDSAAALLVGETIKTMKEKPDIGVTGALREAQLLLLSHAAAGEINANFGNPYAWAPFAVIGDGGQVAEGRVVSSRE